MCAANITMVFSQCSIAKLSESPCFGLLTCSGHIGKFTRDTEYWPCMRFDEYEVDYVEEEDSYINVELNENYSASEIDEFFSYVADFKTYISFISVRNSEMTSINTVVYDFIDVKNIDLSHNEIHDFTLNKFLRLKSLNMLNISNNAINDLVTVPDHYNGLTLFLPNSNSLSVLDLSHNLIVTVPKDYFLDASEILHLNLSHNSIELIDNSTFEGLSKLKTLSLTNNKLIQFGSSIGRLKNLQVLRLDFNYLEYLDDMKITASSSLQKLIVNNNKIKDIVNTLQDAFNLTELDLSYNNIDSIVKSQFTNASSLTWVDLSHNNISRLEATTFKGKHITYFKVHNNHFYGSLDDKQFEGINTDELDLSGGNITILESELFVGQNLQFRLLNFSNNFIFNIKNSSFHNLKLLTVLDLSNNKLQSIDFDKKDLGNLRQYHLKNNLINKITKGMFTGLDSLELLDISHNAIEDIDDQAFVNLNNLKLLLLNNNPLSNALKAEAFLGSNQLRNINLSYTNMTCLKNETLKGTNSLQTFNASYGNTNNIEFNFFHNSGPVEIIDLSHNKIESFLINNTNIERASELYLSSNKLEYITNKTFSGLTQLQILTLDNNKIASIQPGSFASATSIRFLNLDRNSLKSIQFGTFDGMEYLETLRLSRNAFTSITSHLFYKNKKLATLALDQNYLSEIDCYEFRETKIRKLTLGGNLFECTFILKCIQIWGIEITAQDKNYHSENVHGVTCNRQQNRSSTRLVDSKEVVKTTSRRTTTQSYYNVTTVTKISTLNSKTTDKVKPVPTYTSNSNSSINKVDHHILIISLAVIACLLFVLLPVLGFILYKWHKKRRLSKEYQVNQGSISLTNRTEIE